MAYVCIHYHDPLMNTSKYCQRSTHTVPEQNQSYQFKEFNFRKTKNRTNMLKTMDSTCLLSDAILECTNTRMTENKHPVETLINK